MLAIGTNEGLIINLVPSMRTQISATYSYHTMKYGSDENFWLDLQLRKKKKKDMRETSRFKFRDIDPTHLIRYSGRKKCYRGNQNN